MLPPAIKNIIKATGIYMLLCAAIFGMLLTIAQYATGSTTIGFLQFKQEYINITVWRISFYVHVFSSIFVLLAGLTQFSTFILVNHKGLHRFFGKLYVANILFINFPAGMIMAVYANGQLPSKIAFIILDVLWFAFTLKAFTAVKRRDFTSHEKFMIRSFALTLSAITLRTWKLVLTNTTSLSSESIYIMDAWLGFVPNLLVAEWIIYRKFKSKNYYSKTNKH